MTVSDLYQSALLSFAQQPSNERFSNDFMRGANDSQNDFCNRRRWGFLRVSGTVTTVEDQRYVGQPDRFKMFYDAAGSIRITSPSTSLGAQLLLIDEAKYWDEYYDEDETGEPGYIWVYAGRLNFSPIPDAAYTVNMLYYAIPAQITSVESAITVPDHYHEVLQKMIWRRLQDSGYSSVTELRISDDDINRLVGDYAKDDIAKYGGFKMNLPISTRNIRTV